MEPWFADERAALISEIMVDGVIVIDALGAILYANPACEKLFGYAPEEMLGWNVNMLMPESFAAAHDGYLARHRETKVRRIIGIGRELTGRRKDGALFPMHLSVGEGSRDGETVFVGIIYDLTEKRRGEEIILHHQKLDAIGQLSGGVAHDFNNIINVITGSLELAAESDLSPAARRAVTRAQEAAWRAARITQRLLAFARRQPLKPRALDVNAVIEGLADMLRRALGENIELELALSPQLPAIHADLDQLETAVLNIVLNARDAMTGLGVVRVETSLAEPPKGGRRDEGQEGAVLVAVSDNGAGMSPDVLQRAIEPFFTTKDAGAGTGLGLSMVYGFMKQIGGHAAIESESGFGTKVSLYFPQAAQPSIAPPVKAAEPQHAAGEAILVVEDDQAVLEVTEARLKALGYAVLTAKDGASALALLRGPRRIDLVFSDIVLSGGMNGHDVARAVAQLAPSIPVVLTSGNAEGMHGPELGSPHTAFLGKPYSRQSLADVIRAALDAGPLKPA